MIELIKSSLIGNSKMDENIVPIFIQRGADLLSSMGIWEESAVTPEILRQIRVGEITKKDLTKIFSLLKSKEGEISKYYDCSTLDLTSDVTGLKALLILCALAIKEKLWTNRRIFEQQNYFKQCCPHLIAEIIRNPIPEPTAQSSSIPIHSLTMESMLLQYGRIMNKLKKLQLLELERISLLQENVTLASELIDTTHLDKLQQNFADGVQLLGTEDISPPTTSSSHPPKRKPSRSHSKPSETESLAELMQRFETEIQRVKDYDRVIEEDRTNEYLFWRWIASFPQLESSAMNSSLLPLSTVQITSQATAPTKELEAKHLEVTSSVPVAVEYVTMHPHTVQLLQELHHAMGELEDHVLQVLLQKRASINTVVIHRQLDHLYRHLIEEIQDLIFSSRQQPCTASSSEQVKQSADTTVDGNLEGIPVLFPDFQLTPLHQVLYQLLQWDHPLVLQQQFYPPSATTEERAESQRRTKEDHDEEVVDDGVSVPEREKKLSELTTTVLLQSRSEEESRKQRERLEELTSASNLYAPYHIAFR